MTGLDLTAHRLSITGGEQIGYDKLLLAPGSDVRRLNVPGAEFDGVYYLRRLVDFEALKAAFAAAFAYRSSNSCYELACQLTVLG